ncbi:chorismate mutase [Devriesea agamarum]|uniref:chorismate mutase n=1 Tax=Devriesea agamarum TaxID=472569 RepID=UPI000A0337A3|nr:chorismate mutase [Devriesea agamarum]
MNAHSEATSQRPTSTHETIQPRADTHEAALAELWELRASIDNIDSALVNILAERFKCTQRVGRLKAKHGMPPADPAREEQQVARLRALAEESGLDPVFAEHFLKFIVTEVIRHHEAIRDDRDRAQDG